MPRPRRLEYPGITLHVVQRGNNRKPCFFRNHDYEFYLYHLSRLLEEFDCALHAYVLMTNHVHLMLTPSVQGSVSRIMQSLGRDYVRFVNKSLERTGTLWEGRFKSCPVDGANYALACIRYIELNPVRARMVPRPEQYRWSSVHSNAYGRADKLLETHPVLAELAVDAAESRRRYREMLFAETEPSELEAIRLHSAKQRAWGSDEFSDLVEARTGQRSRIGKPGPRKSIVTE